MQVPDNLLPLIWLRSADIAYALLLGAALYTAPWRRLKDPELLNVFLGATVALMVLWRLHAGISTGLGFHFLGITAITLMFRWQLAILASGLALLGVSLSHVDSWASLIAALEPFSINGFIEGIIPVGISWGIYRLVDRWLPKHFFIYIFLSAFLGGCVALGSSTLTLAGVVIASGAYSLQHVTYEYLPFIPLLVVPEGILNGIVMTLMVAYRPRWVVTFDDDRYLKSR